jgi:hypothetical protein
MIVTMILQAEVYNQTVNLIKNEIQVPRAMR